MFVNVFDKGHKLELFKGQKTKVSKKNAKQCIIKI